MKTVDDDDPLAEDFFGGIEQLKTINFYQPQSELAAHHDTLEAYFRAHPVTGVKEAMATIEEPLTSPMAFIGAKHPFQVFLLNQLIAFRRRTGLRR